MIKIGILGYSGRMGQALAKEIMASDKCVFAGGYMRAIAPNQKNAENIFLTFRAEEVIAISDVVVDFTLAEATAAHAQLAAQYKKPFVSGVTGLNDKAMEVLKKASAEIPVLYAPNMSVSLAVMKKIVAMAAKLLATLDYDIAIHDEHHRMKKDTPSGTAKALGEAVIAGNEGKNMPHYSSVRAGAIVGEHEVAFVGRGEVIRLHHSVTDRAIFARGALQGALWIYGKTPGFYDMDVVLGVIEGRIG